MNAQQVAGGRIGEQKRPERLPLDYQQRRDMGRYNLSAVEEFFIDRCAERYEGLFREAISMRGGGK